MLKHGILGLLNYGDMTGYEIRETFQNSLNFFWTAQSSQIYRELRTLEKSGWITMTTIKQKGKPSKNICHLTDSGKTEFLRWLKEENTHIEARFPILMRVFFLENQKPQENIEFFQQLATDCQQIMDSFASANDNINFYEKKYNLSKQSLYWKMTLDFGKRSLQMYIDWANDCAKMLEENK
ncbi:PadR family transcriptional regulator [Clostridiales bacterium COT073_COT-073]|nr:PadR family transcriptional regulator [Clostridiales bacterium COT073_COT-073]